MLRELNIAIPLELNRNMVIVFQDPLDDTQRRILNSLYRRCINLNSPNISLLEGAAGTGKTCMIVNLALQLVYGDGLPKPLKILICSKTNASINDLCRKLIRIRDDTAGKFFDRCDWWMCADCTKNVRLQQARKSSW